MNINPQNKTKYKIAMKSEFEKRVLTGKKHRLTVEERNELCAKAQAERDQYENNNLGRFTKLYPLNVENLKILKIKF